MKKLLPQTALLFFLLSSCVSAARPNVVFFLVDDLGWKDLGCYGSSLYETPSLDAFAKESVKFTSAYAACHVCSPTRASIMTGQYPATLGLSDWLRGRREFPFQKLKNVETVQKLPAEVQTMAEVLKANGYSTGHFGKWHLGEEPFGPTARGFDVQVPKGWSKGWPKAGYHPPFKFDDIPGKEGEYLTDRLTDEALKWVESNHEEPFFLYLSHFAVHDPIQGRKDLVEKYKGRLAEIDRIDGPAFVLEGNPDDESPLSREQLEQLLQNEEAYEEYRVLPRRTVKIKQNQDNPEFAGMVESMDESFGRVIAKLDELGVADNTIVIFFSDNGGMSAGNFGNPDRVINPDRLDYAYSTSNLPLRGGKGWLYEGGIREPMLVKWPGHSKAGLVCDDPVISCDFLPSVVEMTGVAADGATFDGQSFAPLLKGESKLNRDGIYWHFPHYSNHGMQSPGGAIRAGDYKLLEYFENGTVQLFNLREDIGEQTDLARVQPQKAAELKAKLHAWRKRVGAKMMAPNPDYVGNSDPTSAR